MNARELDTLLAEGDSLGGVELFGDRQPSLPTTSPQTWAKAARAAGRAWKVAHQDHYGALERLQAPIEPMRRNLEARLIDPRVSDEEVLALRAELVRARARVTELEQALNSRLEAFMRRWRQENPEPKPGPQTPRAPQAS